MQQVDAKNKTKGWHNKNKGAKKAAKSKKKKLTKKKPVPQQQAKGDKAKQANGNVAGNVRNLELCIDSVAHFYSFWLLMKITFSFSQHTLPFKRLRSVSFKKK